MCIKRCNPDTATRYSYHKMLGLQLPKGFAHRDVTGIEFPRDVILPEGSAWLQCPADDALSD